LPQKVTDLSAQAAFEHIAHAELAPDLLHIDVPALVGEAGIASDDKQRGISGERGDDVLGDAVGEEFLLGIAAHIGKRKHRDRGSVGQREEVLWTTRCDRGNPIRTNPEDVHRPCDVLQPLLSQILKGEIELTPYLIPDDLADADPAGLGQSFQSSGQIDPIPVDVVFFNDHVAEIDADPKPDAPLSGHFILTLDHSALEFRGTAHRVHDTRKFCEQAVASILDRTATMLLDLRLDQFAEMRLEAFVRAFLVGAHQPQIALHISGKDRSETSGLAHAVSPVAKRRPDRKSSRCAGLRQ
jgi:hypothetical protein